MEKKIIAKMNLDTVEPYKRLGMMIPVILSSDHPRFKILSRFDWGFVMTALSDGYIVEILP